MKLSSRNKSKGAQLPQTVHNSSGGTFPAGPTPMQTNYDTSSSGMKIVQ